MRYENKTEYKSWLTDTMLSLKNSTGITREKLNEFSVIRKERHDIDDRVVIVIQYTYYGPLRFEKVNRHITMA